MITVSQLIEMLSKFPADHRVVMAGYEYGIDDVVAPVAVSLTLD